MKLTQEIREEIKRLMEFYKNNPSNSNKALHSMYALFEDGNSDVNQKEFESIAGVIRGRKINFIESKHFGYSDDEINGWLAVIEDLQDMMEYELAQTYPNFDRLKFKKACAT